jgi:hypothetical protein
VAWCSVVSVGWVVEARADKAGRVPLHLLIPPWQVSPYGAVLSHRAAIGSRRWPGMGDASIIIYLPRSLRLILVSSCYFGLIYVSFPSHRSVSFPSQSCYCCFISISTSSHFCLIPIPIAGGRADGLDWVEPPNRSISVSFASQMRLTRSSASADRNDTEMRRNWEGNATFYSRLITR